jgi:hypothetical protein
MADAAPVTVSRRQFTVAALGTLLTTSLLESLFARDLVPDGVQPETERWLKQVNQLCADVKGQKLKQADWQTQLEALFTKVELKELLALVDFERVTKKVEFQEQGERALPFELPKVEGLAPVFGKQIFALKKGQSVVPHGHNNMATAFYVLKGEFHGRHFDRVDDDKNHMFITPTIDRKFAVGETSTISDEKNNVHWFTALSETAFIFNLHVLDIVPGSKKPTERVYVDPNGEKQEGGRIRARILKAEEAYQLYG